ncbi:nitroreductase family protein [Patescibacteria group bacterium]
MEIEQVIKNRRSVRVFSDQKINQETLEKILEAGNWAPSHCNTQSWKFIIVDDQEIKNKIFENGSAPVIKSAPYGILVLYNKSDSDNLEYLDWIQSSSAAIQNMLLTIHDLGLGACWVCHLPSKKTLKKIFNIKESYSPVAYVAFGYPKQTSISIPRKNKIENIYSFNKFSWPQQKTSLNIHFKRVARKIYYKLPLFVKKIISPLVDKFVKKFKN